MMTQYWTAQKELEFEAAETRQRKTEAEYRPLYQARMKALTTLGEALLKVPTDAGTHGAGDWGRINADALIAQLQPFAAAAKKKAGQ